MCRCTLWIWCSRDTVSIATKFTVQVCGEWRGLVSKRAAQCWACQPQPWSPCEGRAWGAGWCFLSSTLSPGAVAVGKAALLSQSPGNGLSPLTFQHPWGQLLSCLL